MIRGHDLSEIDNHIDDADGNVNHELQIPEGYDQMNVHSWPLFYSAKFPNRKIPKPYCAYDVAAFKDAMGRLED